MSTIENGLRADVMRNKMESKDALKGDGYIYVGTGNKITIKADGNTYEIPETTGMDIREAITKYGAKALNPISISSKDDLVNTNNTLTELAKKSFAYTVSNSVKLQDADAANNKEEVIIPAWSKGMVLSSGNDLLVTYGSNTDFSGSFFYDQSKTKWTIVKANIASILDAETMKTTNDGLIPKTTETVNLGSKDNSFNTVYTKYYNGNGINFRPAQFKEDTTNVDIGYGYDAAGAADPAATTPKAHIDAHIFYDGLNQGELSWIKAKGIIPHSNNEINFNIESARTSDLIFGQSGSTQAIGNYIFYNGKGTNTYSDISCKGLYLQTGMKYSSYYNPDGAPLNDPTSQNIVDNIKSINQRLYDLGFRRGAVTANAGVNMSYSSLRRQGNYVIGEIQSVTVDTLEHAVEAFTLPDWAIPKQTDIGINFVIPVTVRGITFQLQLTVTFKRDGHIALSEVPDIPINLNFGYDIMEKPL